MGLEPTNLLTASQALYQLSYAPKAEPEDISTDRGVGSSEAPNGRCSWGAPVRQAEPAAVISATTCCQRSRESWNGA
jgi:hypothetical protein